MNIKLVQPLILFGFCSLCIVAQDSNIIIGDDLVFQNAALKYSKQAQTVHNPIKKPKNVLHHCFENIFEDGTMHMVETSEPRCMLGSSTQSLDQFNRRKRNLGDFTHLPHHFTIPAEKPKEEIATDSYIKLQVRVCALPGAEVKVFDKVTRTILNAFKNGGTSYQCNRWTDEYENSISETSQVQVEYLLPIADDYELSEVSYDFLNENENKDYGHRRIQFKNELQNAVIFELHVKYDELEFIYEPPIELRPLGDFEQDSQQINYEPNWVKTYVLGKRSMCDNSEVKNCQDKFYVGISVEILHLDLDFDRGDYLLVGPGEVPAFWKNSKGHLLSQGIKEKDQNTHKIWINTDSAFLRIVTHNSLIDPRNDTRMALKFKWTPGNTTLDNDHLEQVSQLIKEASIKMCFSGGSCSRFILLQENFVDEVVNIFNRYITDHEKDITTLINGDSVQIFDEEPIIYHRTQYSDEYCQFNLAISSPYDSEYPLVPADVLNKIIFGNSNSRKMLRQTTVFNNCVFQLISWGTILIPIAIIVALSTGLVIVFSRVQIKMLQRFKGKNNNNKESLEYLTQEEEPKEYEDALQY